MPAIKPSPALPLKGKGDFYLTENEVKGESNISPYEGD